MRIAIITDIHEDYQKLVKAMKLLKQAGYDKLVCLGDITGFTPEYYKHTPEANACIDLLRRELCVVLAGNHDFFTSRRLPSYHQPNEMPGNWYDLNIEEQKTISRDKLWLYENEVIPLLSRENMDFLSGLEEWTTLDTGDKKLLFSHFIKPDLVGTGKWFPHRISQLRPHFRFMDENKCSFSFIGHFHPDGITFASRLFWSTRGYKSFRIKRKKGIIICPAISGKKNTGACLIFDSDTNEIIPYILR